MTDTDEREMMEAPDFVDPIFVRESKDVKLIQFGPKWHFEKSDSDKIDYLIKLASSLNHAAQQIQSERDELNSVAIRQEEQIKALEQSRAADRQMIHKQLAAENEKHQNLLKENQGLNRRITELEREIEDLKAN